MNGKALTAEDAEVLAEAAEEYSAFLCATLCVLCG